MAYKSRIKKQLVRSTSAQIHLFVDYMATNVDFANAHGEYAGVLGARKAEAEWESLRKQLKQHGADKSVLQWKQTWRDLKRKARKVLRDNKGQVPIVSDVTFKVLKTIGQNCTVQIQTVGTHNEDGDWELEDNSLIENETDDNKNGEQTDNESNKSFGANAEDDKGSLVEIIVPIPEVNDPYSTGAANKPQHDPLQATTKSMPRLPQLAPKPPPRSQSTEAFSPYRRPSSPPTRLSRSPSLTRRKQLLMARRRKTQSVFTQASNDFVALEQRRLRMEEERDRRLHEREMERLKLELQRIEVQRNHNELLQHLVTIVQNAYELLQQRLQ